MAIISSIIGGGGSSNSEELIQSHNIDEEAHPFILEKFNGLATETYVNNAVESLYGEDAPTEGEAVSVREIANDEAINVVSTQELITVEEIDEICK